MRALIILFAFGFLGACSTAEKRVVEVIPDDISSIVDVSKETDAEFAKVLKEATELQPLELYLYRGIKYNVLLVRGSRVIYISYDNYVKLIDLLKVLENRIEIREQQIDDINNIYRSIGGDDRSEPAVPST